MIVRLVGWFLWGASAFQRGPECPALQELAREVTALEDSPARGPHRDG